MNRTQLTVTWAFGLTLAGLFIYPPWHVSWAIYDARQHDVVHAPIWHGSTRIAKDASADDLKAALSRWDRLKADYGSKLSEWQRRNERFRVALQAAVEQAQVVKEGKEGSRREGMSPDAIGGIRDLHVDGAIEVFHRRLAQFREASHRKSLSSADPVWDAIIGIDDTMSEQEAFARRSADRAVRDTQYAARDARAAFDASSPEPEPLVPQPAVRLLGAGSRDQSPARIAVGRLTLECLAVSCLAALLLLSLKARSRE